MNFDTPINRFGTHSVKWDSMETLYGVPARDGIAMWVADMDFRPPASVQRALEGMLGHGVYGYFGDDAAYLDAIRWWMQSRHGWSVERDQIFTTHGLVNGTAMCVDAFTKPGDGVVLFTPIYHAFARVIKAAGRQVVECKLANASFALYCNPTTRGIVLDGASSTRLHGQFLGAKELLVIDCAIHNPLVGEANAAGLFVGHRFNVVAVFEMRIDILVPVQLPNDKIKVLVFFGRHVLDQQGPRNVASLDNRLVHSEHIAAPLWLIRAERARCMEYSWRNQPSGSSFESVGAR